MLTLIEKIPKDKTMITRIILSISLFIASVSARAEQANDHWYLGVAVGALTYQQSNLANFNLNDHHLILGKQINRYLSAEAHLGSSGSDSVQLSSIPVTLQVDNYLAGFVKARLNVTPADWDTKRLHLYGLLGGTRIKTTSSDPGYTQSGVQTSVAAGAGLEFQSDNIAVQFGYIRYVSGSANNHDYALDSLHIGIIYQFADKQAGNAK